MNCARTLTRLCAVALFGCGTAGATDFGVMETADPIEPRHFKFVAYPISARPQQTREQDVGVSAGIGYGIMRGWDLELQVATYDDASFGGLDLEYAFWDGPNIDASLAIGGHYGRTDFGDQRGFDLTQIVSWTPRQAPRLSLNGAIDVAFDTLDRTPGGAAAGLDERFDTVHLVPGVQYRVSRNVDMIGEVGVGVAGEARSYFSAGLSYYFR